MSSYGCKKQMLHYWQTALWQTEDKAQVEIRYLIARDLEGVLRDEVFVSTRLEAPPNSSWSGS